MEPVTQALLGAATAELVAGSKLRGRALGWGAVIGMSPDLDVLLSPLRDGYGQWLYHRGTTHSLWFGFVVGPVLGWLLWRWRDLGRVDTLPGWIRLSIIALVTHPLLDGFTPYGTQFFAPFLRDRFAWNGVAIVDPFYSVMLGTGVLIAAWRSLPEHTRRKGLALGLALSSAYLILGLLVNRMVEDDLRSAFANRATRIDRVRAYPTIFQPWLRSFVVQSPEATYVGLHSWQEWGCPTWQAYPVQPKSIEVEALEATWQGELFEWFADGDTIRLAHREPGGVTRVRLEDVRYSWATPDARGMWGLEARVDAQGELISGPTRVPRRSPSPDDFARLSRVLLGQLPAPENGWKRPTECLEDRTEMLGLGS